MPHLVRALQARWGSLTEFTKSLRLPTMNAKFCGLSCMQLTFATAEEAGTSNRAGSWHPRHRLPPTARQIAMRATHRHLHLGRFDATVYCHHGVVRKPMRSMSSYAKWLTANAR